jgi:electron transfer flavoprotein alpha subunit
MSVLVYTEINKGRVKKASLECINYATKIAELTNSTVTALVNNADAAQLEEIGNAGASKILAIKNDQLNSDSAYVSAAMEQAAKAEDAKIIIFAFDISGKAIAPRLSAKLKAGLVAGVVDYPVVNGNSLEVKKMFFLVKPLLYTALIAISR